MKTDELLSDLLPCPGNADTLVAAARRHAHRRRQLQHGAAVAAILCAVAATFFLVPALKPAPVVVVIPAPPPSPMLTQNELLDSFGDQPVALVTWPDGRQQLLAIARPPARRSVSR